MNKSEEISINSILTKEEAEELYSLTEDWEVVNEFSKIRNKGVNYSVLYCSASIGILPSQLEILLDTYEGNPSRNTRPYKEKRT